MIYKDKCLELGLPEPKPHDTQKSYLKSGMLSGYQFDTRISRYIGIHNLHTITSTMLRKDLDLFTLEHGRVRCPFTGEMPPQPVDIIYMTTEQQHAYKGRTKKPAKS